MKNIILIDAESALIKKNYESFRDGFNAFITKMMSQGELLLRPEAIENPFDYLNSQLKKPSPLDDVDDLASNLYSKLFEGDSCDELVEALKANLRRLDHKTKKKPENLFILMNPFTYADMHYLKMHNDLIFIFNAESILEEIVMRIVFQTILESSAIRFFNTEDNIGEQLSVLKLVDPKKLYIVSWRPGFIKSHLIDPFENLKGFDFENRLIYYTNFNLPSKLSILYGNEADSLNLRWNLLSLDLLLSKLKTIQVVENNPAKFSELIFVGINFDTNTTHMILNARLTNDHFPLCFISYDIMHPRAIETVDIIYGKISASMEYHGCHKGAKYLESCTKIVEQTSSTNFNNGKKFVAINNIINYEINLKRSKMSTIMTQLLEEPGFQNSLHTRFKDVTLRFPKTLCFFDLDFNKISLSVNENELRFPVVIKSDGCVTSLSDHSHDIILVKTKEALKDLIINEKCGIR